MVRAPCCEMTGLKKGPWTLEEDQILIFHIQRFGHANWRALPKQAGLLRCGKSCRLRWTNYLRPDIKRGNFTLEEEEMIIKLHEMLGNRWSAIASRLPGRTDNEIKNVWHTHLKKRVLKLYQKSQSEPKTEKIGSEPITLQQNSIGVDSNRMIMQTNTTTRNSSFENISIRPLMSSNWLHSDMSSSSLISTASDWSLDFSSQGFLEIDESFWSEALSTENCMGENLSSNISSNDEDETDFWLRVFMESGNLHDLPEV